MARPARDTAGSLSHLVKVGRPARGQPLPALAQHRRGFAIPPVHLSPSKDARPKQDQNNDARADDKAGWPTAHLTASSTALASAASNARTISGIVSAAAGCCRVTDFSATILRSGILISFTLKATATHGSPLGES